MAQAARAALVEIVVEEANHAADAPIRQARDAQRPLPHRRGEHSRDAGDAAMYRLDQADDAGDGHPTASAMIGSEYPALLDYGQAIVIEAPFDVSGTHNLEAACCGLAKPDMRRDWLQWQLSATPLAWFAALREKVSDSLIFVNDLSGCRC